MYKYNEKEYAIHIIKEGFGTKHINQELAILAKYFRDNGEEDVKEALYQFCENNLADFDRVRYFKNINNAVRKAVDKKENLIVIEEIPVFEEELERIDSYDISYEYKKVLFTMMVLEKLNKEYYSLISNKEKNNEHFFGGTTKNYKELVESSGINYSKRNKSKYIHKIIHDLNEMGIVEIKNKGSIKLLYLYDILRTVTIINLKNFDAIGLYYDFHHERDDVKLCYHCDSPMKVLGKKKKYCNICAPKVNREKTKERMKSKRNV